MQMEDADTFAEEYGSDTLWILPLLLLLLNLVAIVNVKQS